jgi:hypothetical protein
MTYVLNDMYMGSLPIYITIGLGLYTMILYWLLATVNPGSPNLGTPIKLKNDSGFEESSGVLAKLNDRLAKLETRGQFGATATTLIPSSSTSSSSQSRPLKDQNALDLTQVLGTNSSMTNSLRDVVGTGQGTQQHQQPMGLNLGQNGQNLIPNVNPPQLSSNGSISSFDPPITQPGASWNVGMNGGNGNWNQRVQNNGNVHHFGQNDQQNGLNNSTTANGLNFNPLPPPPTLPNFSPMPQYGQGNEGQQQGGQMMGNGVLQNPGNYHHNTPDQHPNNDNQMVETPGRGLQPSQQQQQQHQQQQQQFLQHQQHQPLPKPRIIQSSTNFGITKAVKINS